MKNWKRIGLAMLSIVSLMGFSGFEAVAEENVDQETVPLEAVTADYCGYFYGSGWSGAQADGMRCQTPGSYLTGIRVTLHNQPQDMTGTVVYQVNLSGQGWLEWTEDDRMSGQEGTDMPLEAVRINLSGQLAENYDIYTKVLSGGQWGAWVLNGETAGVEGQGLRLDGICIGVTPKGAGEPEEKKGIDPSRPMIALTFDDGPNTATTSRVLNALEASGGKATFFVVGNRVSANQDVMRRMAQMGCEIGNHTYDHSYLTKLSAEGVRQKVSSANGTVAGVTGVTPVLVRPPGGFYDASSLKVLGNMGMSAVMWNLDTRDWKTRNTQATIDAVLGQVKDGDIVLMHDIHVPSVAAAEFLIPELTNRGYQLVTVSELAQYRGGMAPGKVYNSFR